MNSLRFHQLYILYFWLCCLLSSAHVLQVKSSYHSESFYSSFSFICASLFCISLSLITVCAFSGKSYFEKPPRTFDSPLPKTRRSSERTHRLLVRSFQLSRFRLTLRREEQSQKHELLVFSLGLGILCSRPPALSAVPLF